jgi:hypothetical protein
MRTEIAIGTYAKSGIHHGREKPKRGRRNQMAKAARVQRKNAMTRRRSMI